MKTLPPTAQRRQTPSWQPPPPQRRLFFYRALPLLGVESSPRIFTEPAFCEPPPRPLRGLSDTPHRLRDQLRAEPLGWYGGQFLSRTVLATLSSFRRSYFPLSQHSKLKRLPGNCVWIKPHRFAPGGQGNPGIAHAPNLLLSGHPIQWGRREALRGGKPIRRLSLVT